MDYSKRSERRHHVKRVAKARRNSMEATTSRDYVSSLSDNEIATRHPMDCDSRCLLCHYEKLMEKGKRRRRETRQWMKDWGI